MRMSQWEGSRRRRSDRDRSAVRRPGPMARTRTQGPGRLRPAGSCTTRPASATIAASHPAAPSSRPRPGEPAPREGGAEEPGAHVERLALPVHDVDAAARIEPGPLQHEEALQAPGLAPGEEAILLERIVEPPGQIRLVPHVTEPTVVAEPPHEIRHARHGRRLGHDDAARRPGPRAPRQARERPPAEAPVSERPRLGETPESGGAAQPLAELSSTGDRGSSRTAGRIGATPLQPPASEPASVTAPALRLNAHA